MPLKILSAAEAMASKQHEAAAWPKTPEQQAVRLKPFCLPELAPSFSFDREDPIFTIGSCFARNVEKQLQVEGYNVLASNFESICKEEGVAVKSDVLNKFVAGSILNEVAWALDPDQEFDDRSLVMVKEDRFVDMQLAPGMLPMPLDQLRAVRRAVSRYMASIAEARVIIITLGLAEAWFDRDTGLYLNSPPHRGSLALYPDRFELRVLDYQDIVGALQRTVETISKFGREGARIVLTVSPVALGMTWRSRDALIANTYSKAVQRAAAEFITTTYDQVDYMPSFESVTLSTPDLAWRDDRAHASDEAVRINVMRMVSTYGAGGETASESQARAAALHLSKRATSIDDMEAARAQAPNDVLVRYRLGRAYFEAGRHAEAVAELTVAREAGGDHYGADYFLAKALFRLGEFESAIAPLSSVIAREPDLEGPRMLMAKIRKRLG